jgi:hypothetical protein
MIQQYSVFVVAIIAIYAAVICSWDFFRPTNQKDISTKQYEILKQSDQFLSSRDNVTFQSVTCSTLKLNFPSGNKALGLNSNMEVVPIDINLNVDSQTLQWKSLQLTESLNVDDMVLFSDKDPTLRVTHSRNNPLLHLSSFLNIHRTTPLLTIRAEQQNDPYNACFWNVICNESTVYKLTGHGSHQMASYYDQPILDLTTFTTSTRTAPVIKLSQDNNTTSFLQCFQGSSNMFNVAFNGDLKWRNSWFLNTTATTMNIGYNNNTWASFKSDNADVQFNGSIYFGSLDRTETGLYFNGAGNDTSFSDCYFLNRTRSTNDVSELLIQKGRNTNDQIRFRCSNFTFQTPSSNENADNRGDNNDRFTINNTSVNTFGNNLAVTSTNVNLFSTNLVATSSGVNLMDNRFTINTTNCQLFNSITASTNSANLLNGTLVVTPNTITSTGDVNIGSSGQPKTLRINSKTVATPAYFTRFISGYDGGNRRELITHNVSGSNDEWRVFNFQYEYSVGGNPNINTDMATRTVSDGISAYSDDTVPLNSNGIGGNNSLQVSFEGFYRLDLDIMLQGKNVDGDQRLRWMIIKNKYDANTNKIPLSVGCFDTDEHAKHFHLCASTYMVASDKLYIYYQCWDEPDADPRIAAGSGDAIFWNYASITMHSI